MKTTLHMRRARLLVSWAVMGLIGCGGGGDAGDGAGAAVSASTNTPITNTNTSTALSSCGLSNLATTALARINQYRAAGAQCGTRGYFAASAALAWSDPLARAASSHAVDMASHNYFSHTSLDGRTLTQRLGAAGYAWSSAAENIAAGAATVNEVVDDWMASEGHCANLMNPSLVHLGLACASGSSSTAYSSYWTLDLGAPQ